MPDNDPLLRRIMSPEYVGNDPYKGKHQTANHSARCQRDLDRLAKRPAMLAPVMTFIWTLIYKVYWQAFQLFVSAGTTVGGYLRELT